MPNERRDVAILVATARAVIARSRARPALNVDALGNPHQGFPHPVCNIDRAIGWKTLAVLEAWTRRRVGPLDSLECGTCQPHTDNWGPLSGGTLRQWMAGVKLPRLCGAPHSWGNSRLRVAAARFTARINSSLWRKSGDSDSTRWQLAAARRAGFRQAAPFAKDRPQGCGRKDAAGVPADGLVRSMAGRRAARARHGLTRPWKRRCRWRVPTAAVRSRTVRWDGPGPRSPHYASIGIGSATARGPTGPCSTPLRGRGPSPGPDRSQRLVGYSRPLPRIGRGSRA